MRIWFDTEFIEDGNTIDLISIGALREDGAEFYHESAQCDLTRASPWVLRHVVPELFQRGPRVSRAFIADSFVEFAGQKPEFWGYYADYDWVALCQLYGTMMQLPKGWPMFCLDIKQACVAIGNPKLPEQGKGEHHALADARWNKLAWEFVQRQTFDPTRLAFADAAERTLRQNLALLDKIIERDQGYIGSDAPPRSLRPGPYNKMASPAAAGIRALLATLAREAG